MQIVPTLPSRREPRALLLLTMLMVLMLGGCDEDAPITADDRAGQPALAPVAAPPSPNRPNHGGRVGPVSETKQSTLPASNVPASPPTGLMVGDWPQLHGPERLCFSRETGLIKTWPREGPRTLWRRETGPTYAAPSIVGNRLILFHRVGDEEVVESLAADTGKVQWKQSWPTSYVDKYGYHNGPRSTPLVHGDRVYCFGAEGAFYCLKLSDGAVVWNRSLNADYEVTQNFFGVGTSPIIEGDVLLLNVGGPKAGIIGLNRDTGKTLWTATEDGASYSTPVVADTPMGRLAVFLTRAGVVGLEPANGKVAFSKPFRSRSYESVNAADPVVVGDHLFVSSAYRTGGLMLRIDPAAEGKLSEVWWNQSMRNHWATCLVHDGCLYGFDGRHEDEAELRCVELSTGQVKWRKEGLGRGSMIRADGAYWIMAEDGRLLRAELSPQGYRQTAEAELLAPPAWIAPVLSRGRLYIRNEKVLICLDLRERR